MNAVRHVQGLVVPLDRENVDTDAIMPKQFLVSTARVGYGAHVFDGWRYLDPGRSGQPSATRRPNPDFVLNQPRYRGARVLLARDNFGCGSSREHAPWGLLEVGLAAVVAPSFGDIFFNNALKNGLLVVRVPAAQVAAWFDHVHATPGATVSIDVAAQTVTGPTGEVVAFELDPFRKRCLLEGHDDIGLALAHADAIRRHETQARSDRPWAFAPPTV